VDDEKRVEEQDEEEQVVEWGEVGDLLEFTCTCTFPGFVVPGVYNTAVT
jgi:hypothetical protein